MLCSSELSFELAQAMKDASLVLFQRRDIACGLPGLGEPGQPGSKRFGLDWLASLGDISGLSDLPGKAKQANQAKG